MFSPLFGAITEASSVPNPRSSTNKGRLYVAYYSSGAQNACRAEVDTALLLVPKRPKNAGALQSWQFRVTRPSRSSRNFWEYEGNPCPNRPPKLRALLLLGKVTSDFTGEAANKLLADVFVAQDDEVWGCTHWTRDAIQTLVEHEVIALLEGGASAREVWENGREFAMRVKQDSKKPVPTCNQRGKSIASEVR